MLKTAIIIWTVMALFGPSALAAGHCSGAASGQQWAPHQRREWQAQLSRAISLGREKAAATSRSQLEIRVKLARAAQAGDEHALYLVRNGFGKELVNFGGKEVVALESPQHPEALIELIVFDIMVGGLNAGHSEREVLEQGVFPALPYRRNADGHVAYFKVFIDPVPPSSEWTMIPVPIIPHEKWAEEMARGNLPLSMQLGGAFWHDIAHLTEMASRFRAARLWRSHYLAFSRDARSPRNLEKLAWKARAVGLAEFFSVSNPDRRTGFDAALEKLRLKSLLGKDSQQNLRKLSRVLRPLAQNQIVDLLALLSAEGPAWVFAIGAGNRDQFNLTGLFGPRRTANFLARSIQEAAGERTSVHQVVKLLTPYDYIPIETLNGRLHLFSYLKKWLENPASLENDARMEEQTKAGNEKASFEDIAALISSTNRAQRSDLLLVAAKDLIAGFLNAVHAGYAMGLTREEVLESGLAQRIQADHQICKFLRSYLGENAFYTQLFCSAI